MKIRKSVKASCCDDQPDYKQEALSYIKAAMDCLALVPDDDVCKDSIANLSVVLIDLSDVPVDVETQGTFEHVKDVVPQQEDTVQEA